MAGFAAVCGKPAQQHVENMMQLMGHRGPHLSGLETVGAWGLGQCYLHADDPAIAKADVGAPVSAADRDDLYVCYDGEIGNADALAREFGVAPGPFIEERLLLHLYRERGPAMLELLSDAIFAFVIVDGDKCFAARDLLGIKTLFYGRIDGKLAFASELKALAGVADDVAEFPAGHYMVESGATTEFAALPEAPGKFLAAPPERIMEEVRAIIERSFRARVDFERPTACLLSGGMDSSAITCIAAEAYRQRFGADKRIRTYAIGSADSGDLAAARIVAEHLGTDHVEVVIDLDALLEALPHVIYALESFDPSLVRSATSNFLISRRAAEDGFEVLLSGEGGDELFCGYAHLKSVPTDELFDRQIDLFRYLHNNASLRLDRTNLANSVRVVTPLICGELFDYALRIPPEYKLYDDGERKVEKWIFRQAFDKLLPRSITQRLKQEFSQGSGAAKLLPEHFAQAYSDDELAAMQREQPVVRNKEELHYFRLFIEHFGDDGAVDTVGQWQFK